MPMPDAILDRMDAQALEDRLELEEPDEHESNKPVAQSHQDHMPELHRQTQFMPTNAQVRAQTEHQPAPTTHDTVKRAVESGIAAAGLQSPEQDVPNTPTCATTTNEL